MYVINESITRDFGAQSRVFHAFGHHLNAETFSLHRVIIDFRAADSLNAVEWGGERGEVNKQSVTIISQLCLHL